MEFTTKRLLKSQIEFDIEVSSQEFKKFIELAKNKATSNLEIKGFRKGKVPENIAEEKIGKENILIEAADLAVKENYKKAVLESGIEPISQPEIAIKKMAQGDSFVFSAKTIVLPEIKIPDYKKIAREVERKEVSVEEKEVQDALKWLQKSRAKFTAKNSSAQKGDFVEIEYKSSQLQNQTWQKDSFILGEGHFIPGFEEKLVEMKPGEEKNGISVLMPQNKPMENLAGKEVVLDVKIKSVQKVEFPEVNDEFAKNLGQFDNLENLKKNLKEGLFLEKEQQEIQRRREEILDKISQKSECELPEILIEKEQKQMLESLKKNIADNLKMSFEEYLIKVKKTEPELEESFLVPAKEKIKKLLVLREIGEKENVEISEKEVEEAVNKTLSRYSDVKKAQQDIDLARIKEYTREVIRNDKILAKLENFAKI